MEINKNICQLCQLISVEIDAEKLKNHENQSILSKLFGKEIVDEMHLNEWAICSECWKIIKQFHELYESAQTQFNNYKNLINTQQFVKEEPIAQSFCKVENVADIHKENVKNDDRSGDNDNDDFVGDNDFDDTFSTISSISSVSSEKPSPPAPQKLVSPPKKSKPVKKIKKITKKTKVKTISTVVKKKVKTKEEINAENVQIKEYFKMSCDNCNENSKFETIIDARKHYRKYHQQNGHLSCCNRKFFDRIRIVEHIRTAHLKTQFFRCDKCDKNFADKFALTNHMENHAPIEECKFQCDICKKSFSKFYKLTQHMQSAHDTLGKQNSVKCGECGKLFLTERRLNTHIRVVHERANEQICEICAKIFNSKNSLDSHLLEHAKIEQPKVQCTICGAWLKNELGLKKHIDRHNDGLQVCVICKKEAPNKCALNNHMRNVHTERKYKCSVCEKAFKKPIGLREHMASHTGQDLYTCTYCPRTFKSSGNMHSHRKKVHPTEWNNDRQKK